MKFLAVLILVTGTLIFGYVSNPLSFAQEILAMSKAPNTVGSTQKQEDIDACIKKVERESDLAGVSVNIKLGRVLNCKFPPPPVGRWHAVYTEDFAIKHNLPPENISTDLSPGVDYMEMDVQPYGTDLVGIACIVNMLVKKPHDISFYKGVYDELPNLPEDRKLLHLLNIGSHKDKLKSIGSFEASTRDWNGKDKGYRQTTFAMYAEDVLPGYDYIAANKYCRKIYMHSNNFPGGYAFWVNKASIWGKYEMLHRNHDAHDTPKGEDFYNSHFFINIPRELISTIFKGMPIEGQ